LTHQPNAPRLAAVVTQDGREAGGSRRPGTGVPGRGTWSYRYVQALQRGVNPREAFAELVGEPLPQFEKGFRQYLQRLRPDGTLARK
jgi:hypothetical protein